VATFIRRGEVANINVKFARKTGVTGPIRCACFLIISHGETTTVIYFVFATSSGINDTPKPTIAGAIYRAGLLICTDGKTTSIIIVVAAGELICDATEPIFAGTVG
jgi:hypothetical protein